jgi:LPS O-antigen subunit length determinant protein (WzzB/FepE family)
MDKKKTIILVVTVVIIAAIGYAFFMSVVFGAYRVNASIRVPPHIRPSPPTFNENGTL